MYFVGVDNTLFHINYNGTVSPNGKDNDGTDMEVWNVYTEKSHNIMCFYDTPSEKQK